MSAFYLALLLATSDAGSTQTSPPDLAQWALTCYCSANWTPHGVIKADDNGRILYAARHGVTREQLTSEGIAVSESQLMLLRAFGLLNKQGDTYTTAIPSIDASDEAAIRSSIANSIPTIRSAIATDVASIIAGLRTNGYERNAYSVVFSYVLDGLMWRELEKRNAIPTRTPNTDKAFWWGAFWASYPPAVEAPGTNELSIGSQHFAYTWTDRVAPDFETLNIASLESKVPHLSPSSPLHAPSQRIAVIVADTVSRETAHLAIPTLKVAGEKTAALIVGHELIWAVIDDLVKTHVLSKPAALTSNARPSMEDLSALVFVRDGS